MVALALALALDLALTFTSYASLYQHPPGGMRTPEENEAFAKALGVMADVYASAVGTTVLQLKEIPPRPKDHDGALCLFGLVDGADEPAIRAALGSFGDIETVEFSRGMASVRFASHAAALAAKQAPLPEGLCEALDFLYNERSYDGRRDDDEGRSDDDGRGWCALPTELPRAPLLGGGVSQFLYVCAQTGAAWRPA